MDRGPDKHTDTELTFEKFTVPLLLNCRSFRADSTHNGTSETCDATWALHSQAVVVIAWQSRVGVLAAKTCMMAPTDLIVTSRWLSPLYLEQLQQATHNEHLAGLTKGAAQLWLK